MTDPAENSPQENPKIIVDEDWKSQVQAEKEALGDAEGKNDDVQSDSPDAGAASSGDAPPLPPATFANLVTMLATQITMAMAQAANPESDEAIPRTQHLDLAKHLIDTLAMLQEKTTGNLTPEESRILEQVLHELRMAFVSLR